MTLLQAARSWRKKHHTNPALPIDEITEFLQESARAGNAPNAFPFKDWEKVLDEFGVEDDAERIAFLENVAEYL